MLCVVLLVYLVACSVAYLCQGKLSTCLPSIYLVGVVAHTTAVATLLS